MVEGAKWCGCRRSVGAPFSRVTSFFRGGPRGDGRFPRGEGTFSSSLIFFVFVVLYSLYGTVQYYGVKRKEEEKDSYSKLNANK